MNWTEDKQWWCDLGLKWEYDFVDIVCPLLGIKAIMNPDKKTNPYVPDLIVKDKLSDLKHQGKPFFKARSLYDRDPQYTVTFNVKDYNRYLARYPELMIYFWVDWKVNEMEIGGRTYKVKRMCGVGEISFAELKYELDVDPIIHNYIRRGDDEIGNAKDSYLFDIRKSRCLSIKYIGD